MLYRENGQFKTTYRAGLSRSSRSCRTASLISRCPGRSPSSSVPLAASEYLLRAILIPFLILSLAALGLNILVGYCGQISLGTGAFMAVGAYAAYNLQVAHRGHAADRARCCSAASCATVVGVLFGIPSLRIKGLYLAVATLAAQFFVDWAFLRIKWFTNDSASGSVSVADCRCSACRSSTPVQKYLFCLGFVVRVRAAGEEPGAQRTSAASGWRCATWTSPPR